MRCLLYMLQIVAPRVAQKIQLSSICCTFCVDIPRATARFRWKLDANLFSRGAKNSTVKRLLHGSLQLVLHMLHILSMRRFCYTGVPKWVPAGLGSGPWIWTMSKITKSSPELENWRIGMIRIELRFHSILIIPILQFSNSELNLVIFDMVQIHGPDPRPAGTHFGTPV